MLKLCNKSFPYSSSRCSNNYILSLYTDFIGGSGSRFLLFISHELACLSANEEKKHAIYAFFFLMVEVKRDQQSL